jgi:hypothetical protein
MTASSGFASKVSIEEIDASRRNDFSPAFQGRVGAVG